jgi:hypothetical protein
MRETRVAMIAKREAFAQSGALHDRPILRAAQFRERV